ncbi:MAG: SirB1 family protein [Vicinamibacterales bacterium]
MLEAAVRRSFLAAANSADDSDLPRAAALLGRLEDPDLDPAPQLGALTRLGALLTARLERLGRLATAQEQLDVLNGLLYDEERFTRDGLRPNDPRSSFLTDVVVRRTGLPILLGIVYIDVGRRAGLLLEGISFPGHFLVRFRPGTRDPDSPRELIVDPFNRGAVLSEAGCLLLLQSHFGEDARLEEGMLDSVGKRTILIRVLNNLKRLYVGMRSFPQARAVVDLLVALDPTNAGELRDRGLLSYHMGDFRAALRDLETFFRAVRGVAGDGDEARRAEHEQVWEHLKTLRRRVASLN